MGKVVNIPNLLGH
jgi:hypothetical protein